MTAIDLLTTAQVCERLGVGSSTVARWAAEGKLTEAHKLPGIRGPRLFRVADVDALAAERVAP